MGMEQEPGIGWELGMGWEMGMGLELGMEWELQMGWELGMGWDLGMGQEPGMIWELGTGQEPRTDRTPPNPAHSPAGPHPRSSPSSPTPTPAGAELCQAATPPNLPPVLRLLPAREADDQRLARRPRHLQRPRQLLAPRALGGHPAAPQLQLQHRLRVCGTPETLEGGGSDTRRGSPTARRARGPPPLPRAPQISCLAPAARARGR